MAQAASKTCEICVSAPCSWYCLDCEQHYCENCKILHSRQKLSKNHEFKKDLDFIPEVKSKCTDHNEVFSFVCIECDVPVCVCCVTEKHNGHKLSQLKDTIEHLKTKIEQEMLTKLNRTSGNVSKLEQGISSFNGQVETVIRSMTEEGYQIKSIVDQYIADRITSLKEQARKESNRLTSILSDHKTAFKKALDLDNRKERLIDQSRHDGTLMKMLKSLKEDIDKLEVSPLPDLPSATCTPKVVNKNDILQLIGTCHIFETKIRKDRRDRKNKIRPPPPNPTYYACTLCGREQIDYHVGPCPNLTCCHMTMAIHF